MTQNAVSKKNKRNSQQDESSGEKDEYYPDFNQLKKVGLPVEKKRVTTGSWSIQETKIYLKFLEDYTEDFSSETLRRKLTVFHRLSKALRKRTPDQCRSHHQKLQNKFNNDLDAIINFVRGKLSRLREAQDDEPCKGKALTATATQIMSIEDDGVTVEWSSIMGWSGF